MKTPSIRVALLGIASFSLVPLSALPGAAATTSIPITVINGFKHNWQYGYSVYAHNPINPPPSSFTLPVITQVAVPGLTNSWGPFNKVDKHGSTFTLSGGFTPFVLTPTFLRSTLTASVTAKGVCPLGANDCGPVQAFAWSRFGGNRADARIGIVEKPLALLANTKVGAANTSRFEISIGPSELPDELMEVIKLDLFTEVDSNNINILNANLSFGPSFSQSRTYDLSMAYSGELCVLNASNPACPNFTQRIINDLTSSSLWTYDSIKQEFTLLSDFVFPDISYSYIGSSAVDNSQELTVSSYLETTESSPEPVPSPLPVLGVLGAFRYSRSLRKKFKN